MIPEFYALKITQPDSSGNYVGGAEDTVVTVPSSEARELWTFQPVRSGTDVPGHVPSFRRNGHWQ